MIIKIKLTGVYAFVVVFMHEAVSLQ